MVIDASTTLAWCFPDEHSGYADAALVALKGKDAFVPAVCALEVANAIVVGERQKRIHQAEIARFTQHSLSAYDAAYLELAIRRNAPLAKLDRRLEKAAHLYEYLDLGAG